MILANEILIHCVSRQDEQTRRIAEDFCESCTAEIKRQNFSSDRSGKLPREYYISAGGKIRSGRRDGVNGRNTLSHLFIRSCFFNGYRSSEGKYPANFHLFSAKRDTLGRGQNIISVNSKASRRRFFGWTVPHRFSPRSTEDTRPKT